MPDFLFGDDSLANEQAYHRFGSAVHLWSITDERASTPAPAVDALAAQFSAAQVQRYVVAP